MNTVEQARKLVQKYCESYELKVESLSVKKRGYANKLLIKGKNYLSTSSMRMALGYFIFMHFPIRIKEVANIVGYTDHSPISSQRSVIENYITTQDPFFFPYYERVLSLAKEINISTEYIRIYTNVTPFMRYESNNDFAENIKYYENA